MQIRLMRVAGVIAGIHRAGGDGCQGFVEAEA